MKIETQKNRSLGTPTMTPVLEKCHLGLTFADFFQAARKYDLEQEAHRNTEKKLQEVEFLLGNERKAKQNIAHDSDKVSERVGFLERQITDLNDNLRQEAENCLKFKKMYGELQQVGTTF
jgi:hypothetical protein